MSRRSATTTKVFVGSLPQGVTPDDLRGLFEPYGAIAECDISNRCGFLHLEDHDLAMKAIEELNGVDFMGGKISVEKGRVKPRRNQGSPMAGRGGMGRDRPGPYSRPRGPPPRNGFGGGGGGGRDFDAGGRFDRAPALRGGFDEGFERSAGFGDRSRGPAGGFGDRRPFSNFDRTGPGFRERGEFQDTQRFDDRRPPFEDRRPAFEDRRPPFEDRRPSFEDRRPPFEDRRPPFEDRRPPFEDRRPPLMSSGGGFDDRRAVGGFDDRRSSGGFDDRRAVGGFEDRRPPMYDNVRPQGRGPLVGDQALRPVGGDLFSRRSDPISKPSYGGPSNGYGGGAGNTYSGGSTDSRSYGGGGASSAGYGYADDNAGFNSYDSPGASRGTYDTAYPTLPPQRSGGPGFGRRF